VLAWALATVQMAHARIGTVAFAVALGCATVQPKPGPPPVPGAETSAQMPAHEVTEPAPTSPPQQTDETVITDAFARDFEKVQACYKAQLQKQRGLHGRVTLAFGVDNATHHPIDVRTIAPTTITSTPMLTCMVEVVRNITFDADVAPKERETEFHFEMEHRR